MAKSPNHSSNDEIAQLNTPPHSMEAEQAVLGSVIQSVDAWDKIAEVIIQEDFYNRAHRLIFGAINRLITKNSAADPITLKDELESHNELEDIGGFTYLVNLARNTPSSSNITAYANIVRERAIVRELIGVANQIADASFNPEGRASKELLDLAETKVFEIAEKRTAANEGPVSVSSALRKTIKRIEELAGQDKEVTGVSTGFTDLDKKTSGMQPSDLIIVAARPSMGKCIVSGSLLVDPDTGARVTIDEMVANKRGRVTSVNNRFKLVTETATAFVNDGLKPVFEVKTRLGKVIQTTLTHPFLTGNGWKALADINEGDHIGVPKVLPIFGRKTLAKSEIIALVKATNSSGEAKSSGKAHHLLHRLKQDALSKTLNKIKELGQHSIQFLEPLPANAIMGAGSMQLINNSKAIDSYNNFKQVTEQSDVRLPQHAFCLNRQHLALLVQHLYLEYGSVEYALNGQVRQCKLNNLPSSCELSTESFPKLIFTHKSETLAQQIQHLLLRFGVIACLSSGASRSGVKHSHGSADLFYVEISSATQLHNFIEHIGATDNTSAALNTYIAKFDLGNEIESTPSSIVQYILALQNGRDWQQLFKQKNMLCPNNIEQKLNKESVNLSSKELLKFAQLFEDDYLQNIATSDLYWDTIESIRYQGYQQVYDLTVPDLHNFIAQDICVHNTTFAMNLVENALMLEEKPVLVFSLEMPAEQIMMRMLASLSRVDQTAIRTARLEDTDWAKIQSSVRMLNEKDNLFIDDSSGLTPMEVRTRARKLARDRGGISMIMIDYLQLMRVPSLSENRTLEISEISRSLKALAKELQCPVIALSQLNRGLEQRADKRPINSDLRESGAIEQDADLIMFIYRDEVYHENSELQGIAEIIIGKQRNGPIGTTRLTFQGRFSRFENYAGPAYEDE